MLIITPLGSEAHNLSKEGPYFLPFPSKPNKLTYVPLIPNDYSWNPSPYTWNPYTLDNLTEIPF